MNDQIFRVFFSFFFLFSFFLSFLKKLWWPTILLAETLDAGMKLHQKGYGIVSKKRNANKSTEIKYKFSAGKEKTKERKKV